MLRRSGSGSISPTAEAQACQGVTPREPDMMVLERRLAPSSGHLGAGGGGGAGPGAADSRPA